MCRDVYFGDLGIEMVKKYMGNALLRIEVPYNCKGLFIADYALVLEEKHLNERGATPLNLGYDCSTGREITQAYVNSYVSANQYRNTHIAPEMEEIYGFAISALLFLEYS